jgi:MscS family membrane protein
LLAPEYARLRTTEFGWDLEREQERQRHVAQIESEIRSLLDMSQVSRGRLDDEEDEAIVLLLEVADRLKVPRLEEIPDSQAVEEQELSKWVIPGSEITFTRVEEGHRAGDWLVSAETIARLKEFYDKVRHLPYHADAIVGAVGPIGGLYDYNIAYPELESHIPRSWIDALPGWARAVYNDSPVWKWLAAALVFVAGVGVFKIIHTGCRGYGKRLEPESIQRLC